MRAVIFVALVILTSRSYVFGRPLPQKKDNTTNVIPPISAFNFMKKYGYLQESPKDSEALYTEDGLKQVIKTVQRYGAIPETGIIDNATINLMESPRCGVQDIIRKRSKRFIIGAKGWKKRNITYFVANWSGKLGQDVVRNHVKKALNQWGKYGRLYFKEIFDPSADIIIAFGTGYHGDMFPFDGKGNILAHAFFPYELEGYGGDVHFDDDEDWKEYPNTEDGTHFYTVALHELGHSLGLAHSPVLNSVMFPYYRAYDSEKYLEYDDILGMYELYIKRVLDEDKIINIQTTKNYDEVTSEDYGQSTTESTITITSTLSSDSSTIYTTPDINGTVVYEGDYETVDEHKEHDDKSTIPTASSASLPDICDGNFDAVATLREELFIFKDEYIWRLKERYNIEPGYPVHIRRMFPLPKHVKKIDAAYERPDGMIVLFTGKVFWVYDGTEFIENSPKPLTTYGIEKYIPKLDAVQVWAKNGKTYLYAEDQFWRYNETSHKMDPGYPKHMGRWRGVPVNIDAATTWKDGSTYFFKGKYYWKFNNDWIIVDESSPLPSPQTWLGCPKEISD